MPYLISASGVSLVRKYVSNWYTIVGIYLGLVSQTVACFRDGKKLPVSKQNYSEFREELFEQYLKDHGFTYREEGGRRLVTTNNGIKMYLPADYSNVLDEIYLRGAYGKSKLEGRPVIDIGSSIGDTSLYFLTRGAYIVYGFEIDRERFLISQDNIHLNKLDNSIHIYNEAADSRNLSSLIEEKGLRNVYLKIDCEGCEYDLIENLTNKAFEAIDDIVMEYHNKSGQLLQKLTKLGYKTSRKKKILIPQGLIYASRRGSQGGKEGPSTKNNYR